VRVEETTYYLEMSDPGELLPSPAPRDDVEVRQARIPCAELNRYFYTAVGGDWYWIDRLGWTLDQWREHVRRPEHRTWVLYVSGTPAGYFELEGKAGADIEIAHFGLLPQFVGQGLGAYLLTEATRQAWQQGASRVWVHTSSFDHPRALGNYQARGFRLYQERVSPKELPEQAPGPWPGARRRPEPPPASDVP